MARLPLKKTASSDVFFSDDLTAFERNFSRLRNDVAADLTFDYGFFRDDLSSYRSIQRDFPRVYGINDGGLHADVPAQRRAQALQFKGYLLFFERFLADYLAQLAHVRDLFSMTPDSRRTAEQRRTYFNGGLDDVPDVDKLLRFARATVGSSSAPGRRRAQWTWRASLGSTRRASSAKS